MTWTIVDIDDNNHVSNVNILMTIVIHPWWWKCWLVWLSAMLWPLKYSTAPNTSWGLEAGSCHPRVLLIAVNFHTVLVKWILKSNSLKRKFCCFVPSTYFSRQASVRWQQKGGPEGFSYGNQWIFFLQFGAFFHMVIPEYRAQSNCPIENQNQNQNYLK